MCEDTVAADQITQRLNSDVSFKELNGVTINLHTNLKGKVKKEGKGPEARDVFVESEKEITDEDLKALRKLSRELDANTSQYRCIVSVIKIGDRALDLRHDASLKNISSLPCPMSSCRS